MSKAKTIIKKVQTLENDPSLVRELFYANSFPIPTVECSNKNPKGYYSLIEKLLIQGKEFILRENDEELYNVCLGHHSVKNPQKFFIELTKQCQQFDENNILSIKIQKASLQKSKAYYRFDQITDESTFRMIICIKNPNDPLNTRIRIGGDKGVFIIPTDSFGTILLPNFSKIDLFISEFQQNTNKRLAEAFFVIIDFKPDADFKTKTIVNTMSKDKRDFSKTIKKLTDKIDNFGDIAKKFMSKEEEKNPISETEEMVISDDDDE